MSIENFLDGIRGGFNSTAKENFSYGSLKWSAIHHAYTNVLLIPVFSLASYVPIKKVRYNYFQHIILNFFIASPRIFEFLVILSFSCFITNQNIEYSVDKSMILVEFYLLFGFIFSFSTA